MSAMRQGIPLLAATARSKTTATVIKVAADATTTGIDASLKR